MVDKRGLQAFDTKTPGSKAKLEGRGKGRGEPLAQAFISPSTDQRKEGGKAGRSTHGTANDTTELSEGRTVMSDEPGCTRMAGTPTRAACLSKKRDAAAQGGSCVRVGASRAEAKGREEDLR